MAIVQLFPEGGGGASGVSFEPNEPTTFTANTVPYINGAQEVVSDVNFTYQSSRLGIGLSAALGATVHIQGANSSAASYSLIVQSATNEIIKVENDRSILIGAGSKLANTTYTVNAIGAGAASTDVNLAIVGGGNDNIFKFFNSTGYTAGGLHIRRDSASISGRSALTIGSRVIGVETDYITITSGGLLGFTTANSWADSAANYIQASNTAGKVGMLYNIAANTDTHIFRVGRSAVRPQGTLMQITAPYSETLTPHSGTATMLLIDPTVNSTTAGTVNLIGIDYNPTLTALGATPGVNYGLRIRLGLSGFGLGATLPTAIGHFAASSAGAAGTASIKINDGVILATPEDGAIEHASDHLYFTTGTFRRAIDNDFDATPDTDHTANGFTTNTINAGATIAIMETCYLASDGEWALTDADAESTSIGMLAISLEAKNDGEAMRVALPGSFVRDDTWNWTVGGLVYLSTTPGALTQTAPSGTGDVVRVVGWATHADRIYFDPSTEHIVIV